jgi:simple sugar transport system permease protein
VGKQGIIALATVILGRLAAWRAAFAAFVIAADDAHQLSLQLFQFRLPTQVLLLLPCAVTIVAISGILGKI